MSEIIKSKMSKPWQTCKVETLGISIDEITHTKGGVPWMRMCAYKGEEG